MINISIFLYIFWLNLKIFDSLENNMCINLWTEKVQVNKFIFNKKHI